jgi:hypothetical protein
MTTIVIQFYETVELINEVIELARLKLRKELRINGKFTSIVKVGGAVKLVYE